MEKLNCNTICNRIEIEICIHNIYHIYYNIIISQYSRCKNKTKRWGQAKKEAPGVRSR